MGGGLPKGRGRGRAELVSARCLSAGLGRGLVQTFVWTLCRSVVSMRDLFHFVWPHAAVGLTTFVSLLLLLLLLLLFLLLPFLLFLLLLSLWVFGCKPGLARAL